MALFVRKFNKMFKKSGFFNKNKDKDTIKTKRTSKRLCFGCGKEGHFIAECPNIRVRRRDTNKNDKNKNKEVGEAHLGEEWDSNDDSSDSDDEVGLATISIGEPINKSSLFEVGLLMGLNPPQTRPAPQQKHTGGSANPPHPAKLPTHPAPPRLCGRQQVMVREATQAVGARGQRSTGGRASSAPPSSLGDGCTSASQGHWSRGTQIE
jgi:hypothetical protein